jgi:glucose/arabinose dehydrogenase
MLRKSVSIFLLLGLNLSFISPAQAADIDVDIQTMNISKTVTKADNGQRGPALAVLKNGNLLLGGGPKGGTVFLGDGKKRAVITMGDLISANQRLKDSRFAITDIAVLSETTTSAKLLVSYPRLGTGRKCVEVVVDQVDANLRTNKIVKKKTWFVSKPCVPISAVQHAAGRMERIDANSVYLTIGDLGFTKINDLQARGDLGSVFQISESSVKKISTGHRNAQGIVLLANKALLISEHGPRGGDEINVIKPNADYGWPFVTFGKAYTSTDYVKPTKAGTHDGFEKPVKYWVPSIAPTELVQLPSNWGKYSKQIVMGTLREESLVFMTITPAGVVTGEERIEVGERIRDLDIDENRSIVATTDSGKIMVFKLKK